MTIFLFPNHDRDVSDKAYQTEEPQMSAPAVSGRLPAEGHDPLGMKEALERNFYGQVFSDTTHIQLICQIQDMGKTLAMHMSGVMARIQRVLDIPYLYTLSPREPYEVFLARHPDFRNVFENPRLGYWNLCVEHHAFPNCLKLTGRECYEILARLSALYRCLYEDGNMADLDSTGERGMPGFVTRAVDDFHRTFLKMSGMDLEILFRVLAVPDERREAFACDYYCFIARKKYRHQDYSIAQIRSQILRSVPEAMAMEDASRITFRLKRNRLLDYLIYHYYRKNTEEAEALVQRLRSHAVDRQTIYREAACRVWPWIRIPVLRRMVPLLTGAGMQKMRRAQTAVNGSADSLLRPDTLAKVCLKTPASQLAADVAYMTLFMDGKESRSLLSELIQHLERIADFTRVLQTTGVGTSLQAPYQMFMHPESLLGEMQTLYTITRTRVRNSLATREQIQDAIQFLGLPPDMTWGVPMTGQDETAGENMAIRETLTKTRLIAGIRTAEALAAQMESAREGTADRELRRFLARHVVNNARFRYLMTLCPPCEVRRLITNRALVRSIISRMPDFLIGRYAACIFGAENETLANARERLIAAVYIFHAGRLRGIRQNDRISTQEEKTRKARQLALVRLYMTLGYLAVKSISLVNARYALAMHFQARDTQVLSEHAMETLLKRNLQKMRKTCVG